MLDILHSDNWFHIRFSLSLLERSRLARVCRQLRDEETCFAIPRLYLDPIDVRAAPLDGTLGMWLHLLGDVRTVRLREDARIKSIHCLVSPQLTHPPALVCEPWELGVVALAFHPPYEVIDGFNVDAISLIGCFQRRSTKYNWRLYASRGDVDALDYVDNDSSLQLLIKRRPAFAQFFVV